MYRIYVKAHEFVQIVPRLSLIVSTIQGKYPGIICYRITYCLGDFSHLLTGGEVGMVVLYDVCVLHMHATRHVYGLIDQHTILT